jgi:hypothetical protein
MNIWCEGSVEEPGFDKPRLFNGLLRTNPLRIIVGDSMNIWIKPRYAAYNLLEGA